MQCKCGEETRPQTHLVKTLKKAREWHPKTEVHHLPLAVEQDKCPACGRVRIYIWAARELLDMRG